jgi:hypothetical protein
MINGTIISTEIVWRKKEAEVVTIKMKTTKRVRINKKKEIIKDKEEENKGITMNMEIIRAIIAQTIVKMELKTITENITITDSTTITEGDTIITEEDTKITTIAIITITTKISHSINLTLTTEMSRQ